MSDAEAEDTEPLLPEDAQVAIRNRRQRRLTAKYAEALEEQQTRRQRRRGSNAAAIAGAAATEIDHSSVGVAAGVEKKGL